jgi:putative hydrolase of the HAD superfamily
MTSTGNVPVKAVWTDFGGVLTPPIGQTLVAFCARYDLPPEALVTAMTEVARRYGTDDLMLPLDTPLVTEEEWLGQVGEVLRERYQISLRLTTMADAWFGDRAANLPWVDELRRARESGVFVGMLSNMVPAWDPYWRRMVDAEELFDDVVLSFEVGHRKPDPEIFELAAKRAGVLPRESVFVDDLATNCAGAAAAGWRAVHFTDTATAAAAVQELLRSGRTGAAT